MAAHRLPLERVDWAQTTGETDGFIKIVATPSGKVVRATMLGPVAAELTNELLVAIACGVDRQRRASAMHVYPPIGLGIHQIASDFAFRHARRGLRGTVARDMLARFRR